MRPGSALGARENALERWHAYEAQETEQALREWCADRGLELAVNKP